MHALPAPLTKSPSRVPRLLHRCLSTTVPRPATPLYMLAALSHARETQHYARRSGLGVTNHVPTLEAIKSSEVDPFVMARGAEVRGPPTVGGGGRGRVVGSGRVFVPALGGGEGSLAPAAAVGRGEGGDAGGVGEHRAEKRRGRGYGRLVVAVLVAGLVALNANLYQRLDEQSRQREALAWRLQHLEHGSRERKVRAVPAAVESGLKTVGPASAGDTTSGETIGAVAVDAGPQTGLGTRISGLINSAFWAS